MSSAPTSNMRCVGESRASIDTSIPKTMCQNMSPIPPAMKTIRPATEVPYPMGIAPVNDDAKARFRITSHASQIATAR